MLMTEKLDPARITQHLRAVYQTRILVAAICHLKVLEQFKQGSRSRASLQASLNLRERPSMVLFPALCAMGILGLESNGNLFLTELGNYLTLSANPNLIGYLGLSAEDPGVVEMAQLLIKDGPEDKSKGIAYVMDAQEPSPMDHPETARYLTMALAGRARLLAPIVAPILPTSAANENKLHLLDIAAGTGYYSYEWLRLNPNGSATLFDRPEVLKIAAECLEEFCESGKPGAKNIKSKVQFFPGDMLTDTLPKAEIILAFSLFHDWPTDTCLELTQRFSHALYPKGQLWVHDAFLNDAFDGPLAVTDYSSQLFSITKGRCYSRQEHFNWFRKFGLTPNREFHPTQMDYGLISAFK